MHIVLFVETVMRVLFCVLNSVGDFTQVAFPLQGSSHIEHDTHIFHDIMSDWRVFNVEFFDNFHKIE
jgi:hypothetical protein